MQKSRETHDGGYTCMMRRVERVQPSEETLLAWRFDLTDVPPTERGPFWRGEWDATGVAFDTLIAKGN